MPYNTGWTDRENIRQVVANATGLMKDTGREFLAAYVPEDSNGFKLLRPGLIVAFNTAINKYVPYSSTAAYGTGSDTAAGVFADDVVDMTYGNAGITPVYHGEIIEANCFVLGGTLGTISNTIKTQLSDIHWV